jgi:colanic acid/amylovoran biosynthesis protein
MSKRIMLTGIHGMMDNGEVALLIGAVSSLKQLIPDARFYLASINGGRDESRLGRAFPEFHADIELIRPFLLRGERIPWRLRTILLLPQYIVPYARSAVGVHVGADGYSDETIGGPLATITHSYQLLLGRVLRKPVVACAQSIGPFHTSWTRFLSRSTLNRITLITARERITQDYLKHLGVTKPVHLVADLAFLMEPAPRERVDDLLEEAKVPRGRRLACLTPSQLVHHKIVAAQSDEDKAELYTRAMVELVDYLGSKDVEVLILCQAVEGGKYDDTVVGRQICARATHKPWMMKSDLTPQELKGLMGRCEIMVSSKMHSAVFATSMGTPTVVIGYHSKVHGIIGEMMGQEDFIVDIGTTDFSVFQQKLLAKTEQCWLSRERIRAELQRRLPEVKQMSLRNAALIADLLQKGH